MAENDVVSKMRVLIFGANGMLGHKVYQACRERFETWAAVRQDLKQYAGLFDASKTARADAHSMIESVQPDAVVNCIGIVKQWTHVDSKQMYLINSAFSHRLATLCAPRGIRLIHISTDCVFSGRNGEYTEADAPDPVDVYGWSKLLGEIHAPRCLTLRTSFIGRELDSSHGLAEWLISNRGKQVRGYTEAVFSGVTTNILANLMVKLLENQSRLYGVYHVGAEPISKFHLLHLLNEAYGLGVEILPDATTVICNRSLVSARFRAATGFDPPSWPEMIEEMRADPTPYDEWRK